MNMPKVRWEGGAAECRVCGWRGRCVLEVDIDDVARWERVREHMECSRCGHWTVQFAGPRASLSPAAVDPASN
jgi:hypothetical protein